MSRTQRPAPERAGRLPRHRHADCTLRTSVAWRSSSCPRVPGATSCRSSTPTLKNSPVRGRAFSQASTPSRPRRRPRAAMPLELAAPARGRRKAQAGAGVGSWTTSTREEHIYLHALPRPGGQRELGELVSRLHVNWPRPQPPPWEVHLIEGLEGGRYAVYNKLHHSQFDGKRGMALNRTCARPTPPRETCRRSGRSLSKHTAATRQRLPPALRRAAERVRLAPGAGAEDDVRCATHKGGRGRDRAVPRRRRRSSTGR